MREIGGPAAAPPAGRVAEPVTVGGVTVEPGRMRRFELPVARLTTGTWMGLPVAVINGARPGPRVWLSAAIHGDEIIGVEIIRRVVRELRPRRLRGAVIAVPIVNVFGFVGESRYLPDRRDLNRSFPGSPKGSLAARLAHLFVTEVVDRCQFGVDLHSGTDGRVNLPQIRCDLDAPGTRRVAEAFGAPVVVDARTRDGSLRATAVRRGIPVLVYEGGEALRFDDEAIRIGVEGVRRVLAALEMDDAALPPARPPLLSRRTRWVRARRSGICHHAVALGERVRRGQTVAVLTDPLGTRDHPVRTPLDGIVIGRATLPLVSQGDALVHVAEVEPAG